MEIPSRLARPRRFHGLPPIDQDHGAQEIIKTAFEAGINMFDTAEEYADGKSEKEMFVLNSSLSGLLLTI